MLINYSENKFLKQVRAPKLEYQNCFLFQLQNHTWYPLFPFYNHGALERGSGNFGTRVLNISALSLGSSYPVRYIQVVSASCFTSAVCKSTMPQICYSRHVWLGPILRNFYNTRQFCKVVQNYILVQGSLMGNVDIPILMPHLMKALSQVYGWAFAHPQQTIVYPYLTLNS